MDEELKKTLLGVAHIILDEVRDYVKNAHLEYGVGDRDCVNAQTTPVEDISQSMPMPKIEIGDKLRTAAELSAAPVGTVVLDSGSDAWQKYGENEWGCTCDEITRYTSAESVIGWAPFTVIHLPRAD